MIKSFLHKGLAELHAKGRSKHVAPALQARVVVRLAVLGAATTPGGMDLPGYDFHPLRGKPQRYSVHVNGPWCITFEWEDGHAIRVDLENYH